MTRRSIEALPLDWASSASLCCVTTSMRSACFQEMISVSCGNSSSFMNIRLASLGFGNVGRALVKMLDEKAAELERRYHLTFTFGGALTRTSGGWISTRGVIPAELAAGGWPAGGLPSGAEHWGGDSREFAA